MRVAVIVQSRMSSERLPGKALADICGRPLLAHVLSRASSINASFFALACPPEDAETFAPIADAYGFAVFAEPEGDRDVLGKYARVAAALKADTIVRVTGDCPLLDAAECNRLLASFKGGYLSNTYPVRTVPSGFDCEVFSWWLLAAANVFAEGAYAREHVTPWMQRVADRGGDCGKLSVDTPEDLALVRAVMEAWG